MRICATMTAVLTLMIVGDVRSQEALHSRNLVNNPSLEEEEARDNGLPEGWGGFYAQPADSFIFSIVDGGRTGKKAIQIEGDGTFGALPANRVELDRTKRYVVRGWVKIEGVADATADVKFHYYHENGRYLGQTRIGYVSPTTDEWQFVTVTDRAESFPEAGKIGLALAATGKVKARYDDLEMIAFDKGKLLEDFDERYGITRSPQLALLGRRIGKWTTKTTIKPCVWFPEGTTTNGVEKFRWSLGGQFVEGRPTNLTTGVEYLQLMTFDRASGKYRFWIYDSRGNFPRGDMTGTWDKETQSFSFQSEDDRGVRTYVVMKLIDEDVIKWSGVWKDKDDRILLDLESTVTRDVPVDDVPNIKPKASEF